MNNNSRVLLPQSIIKRKKKKKNVSSVLKRVLIRKESCHLCRIKYHKDYFLTIYETIPNINMSDFIEDLKKYEDDPLMKTDKQIIIYEIFLSYLNKIYGHVQKWSEVNSNISRLDRDVDELKINSRVIQLHFENCIYRTLLNKKLKINNEIDDLIKDMLIPNVLFEEDEVNGGRKLNKDNIRSLLDLKKIGSMEIDDHVKLRKI